MKTSRLLFLCALAAAGGCHRDSNAPAAPATPKVTLPVVAKQGPGAEQLTVGMVEAASQGKSQLPVKLKFELQQKPMLGQPLDISIAVLPQIDANLTGVQAAAGGGLTVAADTSQADAQAVTAGQVYRQTVKVTPTADGVLLLNVTVSLKHDEITESRVFSIPLIVGQ